MHGDWNIGQLLFGIQITLAGIVFALIGVGAAAAFAAVTGFLICFNALVAKPRTGP